METIGFIGVGNMGRPMVERLASAGHSVIAFDTNTAALAGMADTAATIEDLAERATVLFLSLPTPPVVEAVATRIAAAPGTVDIVVDLSTTGPAASRAIAARLEGTADFVDCPVSGGVAGARAGLLALMVGAPERAVERVRPLLEQFGKVFHVGPEAGMGQMMKVINNLMSACALTVSAEGVTMATKAGLDPAMVVAVLNAGSGRNSATLDKFPRQILPGTFDAGFAMGLMLKDVLLCLEQAHAMGLTMPAAEVVAGEWRRATEALGADADFTRIVELAERAAGVVIRSKPEHDVLHV